MQQWILNGIVGCLLLGGVVSCADSDSKKKAPVVEEPIVEEPAPTLTFPPSPMAWVEQVDNANP